VSAEGERAILQERALEWQREATLTMCLQASASSGWKGRMNAILDGVCVFACSRARLETAGECLGSSSNDCTSAGLNARARLIRPAHKIRDSQHRL
jgi:hypothetical protein